MIDASGELLNSFISLNTLALARCAALDRRRIAMHTRPGGVACDPDSK